MYPPPPDNIVKKLCHGYVFAVSFGKFTIHLTWDNGNQVSFSAPFRFASEKDLPTAQLGTFPLSESEMMRVLGSSVVAAKCEADGTLNLRFSNGDKLIVYGNDPSYEAYTMLVENNEYTV